VSADSPSDIWAVGHQYIAGAFPPLMEHWDGVAWTVAAQPPLVAAVDVVAFGPADVWTGGWNAGTKPGFAHWDGIQWMDVPSPEVPVYGQIFALSGPTTNKLFAVGDQASGVLVERWDGAEWRVIPAPSPGTSAQLHDVAWTSGGPAWAVGTTEVNFGEPLVERTCRS
jgi:hypothetical protein